jgi:hypothetical protein
LARDFYEQKLAGYARLTEAAAKIAATKAAGANAAQLQDSVAQFHTLVWGPVAVTRGRDVGAAIVSFDNALQADADAQQLQQLSVDLAHLCANDAGEGFPQAGQHEGAEKYGPNSAILASMSEITRAPEALHAASQWLAMLDAGQYDESWQAASASLQASVTQEQWERKAGGLRKALGAAGPRKFKSEDYVKPAPGSGDPERIVLQFATQFAERNEAVETVTATPDKDGNWKVSAYSAK